MGIVLTSSCQRESKEKREENWNPQAQAYLESRADNEKANTEKGWIHVEGDGYHYKKPEGWTESSDLDKGVYTRLTPPAKDLIIKLTSRYVESVPEGVHDLRGWVELQYSLMGMPDAIQSTRDIEVANGEALEARIRMKGSFLLIRSFVDIFQDPENKRMWLLILVSKDESRLDTPEVREFLSVFRVENFRWLPEAAPQPTTDESKSPNKAEMATPRRPSD